MRIGRECLYAIYLRDKSRCLMSVCKTQVCSSGVTDSIALIGSAEAGDNFRVSVPGDAGQLQQSVCSRITCRQVQHSLIAFEGGMAAIKADSQRTGAVHQAVAVQNPLFSLDQQLADEVIRHCDRALCAALKLLLCDGLFKHAAFGQGVKPPSGQAVVRVGHEQTVRRYYKSPEAGLRGLRPGDKALTLR